MLTVMINSDFSLPRLNDLLVFRMKYGLYSHNKIIPAHVGGTRNLRVLGSLICSAHKPLVVQIPRECNNIIRWY